jgi:hypothetical protein
MTEKNPLPSDPLRLKPEPLPKPRPERIEKSDPKKKPDKAKKESR